jgi:hypothetical protein
MMKIATANAVARTSGFVTLAIAVFAGPILKKKDGQEAKQPRQRKWRIQHR